MCLIHNMISNIIFNPLYNIATNLQMLKFPFFIIQNASSWQIEDLSSCLSKYDSYYQLNTILLIFASIIQNDNQQ